MSQPSTPDHRRRDTDPARLFQALERVGFAAGGGVDPIVGGRLLLVAAGLISSVAAPLLHPTPAAWIAIVAVTFGMAVLLLATMLVPWNRLPTRATLVFPAAVCAALTFLSTSEPAFFAPLTGLISLCFAYIGLTQPPRTGVFAVPVAAAAFVYANGGLTGPVAVRLFIGACIWTLLAELLARSTARQSELADALRAAAHTDVLTGVSNRRGLQLQLSLVDPGDAIVLCDLDNFKRLNDTFGHDAGDRVLADFGALLRTCLRENDYCARFGGEEFVLALPATSEAGALLVLERLRGHWSVLQPTVTFSAGIAICRSDRPHGDTLAAADHALYEAKAEGRNTDRLERAGHGAPAAHS